MPPRAKKAAKKRSHSPETVTLADKSTEVHQRLAEIEMEVEKRCEDIQMNTQLFIESSKATFAAHMMKFPKATRGLTTDEFFGEEVQRFDDVKAKAEFILMSACKPGRAPLTQARPPAHAPTTAPLPSSSVIPGSAMKPGRPPRGFETPKPAGRGVSCLSTPVQPAGAETPALLASVYVNKIKALEDELRALKERYEAGKA